MLEQFQRLALLRTSKRSAQEASSSVALADATLCASPWSFNFARSPQLHARLLGMGLQLVLVVRKPRTAGG
jgi:hypothetical protein